MFIAFFDYIEYRLHLGRYSGSSIENAHGKLATSLNFPTGEFPKPGQIIIVHTRNSFISWLVMYFTGSIWSHTSIGVDRGDIVEATLGGVIAHPFTDILNGTDYLLIGRPPVTPEQEHALVESARATVGVTKFSYSMAAIIGLRLLLGIDEKYDLRLSIDLLVMLLLTCWFGRNHGRIVKFFSTVGVSYIAIVLFYTRHRRNLRASHAH